MRISRSSSATSARQAKLVSYTAPHDIPIWEPCHEGLCTRLRQNDKMERAARSSGRIPRQRRLGDLACQPPQTRQGPKMVPGWNPTDHPPNIIDGLKSSSPEHTH